MKIAITSQGADLQSEIDPRFGRARYLIFLDVDSEEYVAHDNSRNCEAAQGAGIQAAGEVVNSGAAALVTGRIGPKALDVLRSADIQVYQGVSGSVSDVLQAFKSGRLDETKAD